MYNSNFLIFSSEITGPIATKLYWNGPWMAPFQKRLPTKMVTKLKIEKRGMKFELYIAALVSVKMRSYFNCSYMARSKFLFLVMAAILDTGRR
jgi:hypothetical protein